MANTGALQAGKGGGKRLLTRAYKQAIDLKAGFLSDLGVRIMPRWRSGSLLSVVLCWAQRSELRP